MLLDGDYAYKTGEPGDRMYFLKTGYVQITGPNTDLVVATIGSGGYFGELALFAAIQNISRQQDPGAQAYSAEKMFKRSGAARALSDCILVILMKHDFEVIAERLRINVIHLPPPMHGSSLRLSGSLRVGACALHAWRVRCVCGAQVQRMMGVATEELRCRRPSFLSMEGHAISNGTPTRAHTQPPYLSPHCMRARSSLLAMCTVGCVLQARPNTSVRGASSPAMAPVGSTTRRLHARRAQRRSDLARSRPMRPVRSDT